MFSDFIKPSKGYIWLTYEKLNTSKIGNLHQAPEEIEEQRTVFLPLTDDTLKLLLCQMTQEVVTNMRLSIRGSPWS